MILQEQALGASRMHRDFMHALPKLRMLVGQKFRADAAILRRPSRAAIFGAVNAARRNCHVNTLLVAWIEDDGMQGQAAVAGHPTRTMRMIEQTANEGPGFSGV